MEKMSSFLKILKNIFLQILKGAIYVIFLYLNSTLNNFFQILSHGYTNNSFFALLKFRIFKAIHLSCYSSSTVLFYFQSFNLLKYLKIQFVCVIASNGIDFLCLQNTKKQCPHIRINVWECRITWLYFKEPLRLRIKIIFYTLRFIL